MTYQASLGLREAPFGPTADPGVLYEGSGTRSALEAVAAAVSAGEPVLTLTGAAGTGKTTLCRALLQRLDSQVWTTVYLSSAEPDPRTLTVAVGRAVGAKVDPLDGIVAAQRALGLKLLELARAGRRVLVVIDECQAMPPEALEQARQLTNLETSKRKLLQLLLCGQPAFIALLDKPPVARLDQRVGFAHTLKALPESEVAPYVDLRLRAAGYAGESLVSSGAAKALFKASGGTPRLLNAVAHQAFLLMHAEGARRLETGHVRRAAADTAALPPARRSAEVRHEWFWRCTAALLLIGVLWTAWVAYQLRPRELVTQQAFAIPVQGRLSASEPTMAPALQETPETGRDPGIIQSLGLPGAKIAAYSPDFALSLARLQLQRENFAGALAALDAATPEIADRPEYYYLRGTVLRHLKQNDLAEEAFRRALGAGQGPNSEASKQP